MHLGVSSLAWNIQLTKTYLTLISFPMVNVSPSLTTVSVPGDCLDPP